MYIVYIFVQKSSRPCALLQHFFSTMPSFESLQTFKTEADEWFTPKSFKDCLYQLVSGAKESFQVCRYRKFCVLCGLHDYLRRIAFSHYVLWTFFKRLLLNQFKLSFSVFYAKRGTGLKKVHHRRSWRSWLIWAMAVPSYSLIFPAWYCMHKEIVNCIFVITFFARAPPLRA